MLRQWRDIIRAVPDAVEPSRRSARVDTTR
jgi:hypothetical protein